MSERDIHDVAIACGGTGGHLFPGIAVARALADRGCAPRLMVSAKAIDREATAQTSDMPVDFLPAVGLQGHNYLPFIWSIVRSYRRVAREFRRLCPDAVLAMGGFTASAPVWAGRRSGARIILHEANSIPGRANRLLARHADLILTHFEMTKSHFRHTKNIRRVGMPVRSEIHPRSPAGCRRSLGMNPEHAMLLVTGGSQGARFLNELVIAAAPELKRILPELQILHLAGPVAREAVAEAYLAASIPARVEGFFHDMPLAYGAATAVLARAGASSLAELAASELPAVLLPLPTAADNHQVHNARAYCRAGAGRYLEQSRADTPALIRLLVPLLRDESARRECIAGCRRFYDPHAAQSVAEAVLGSPVIHSAGVPGYPNPRVSLL